MAFSVEVPWHLPTKPIFPVNDFVAARVRELGGEVLAGAAQRADVVAADGVALQRALELVLHRRRRLIELAARPLALDRELRHLDRDLRARDRDRGRSELRGAGIQVPLVRPRRGGSHGRRREHRRAGKGNHGRRNQTLHVDPSRKCAYLVKARCVPTVTRSRALSSPGFRGHESFRYWWTKAIAMLPSPTAAATRFTGPNRTSPLAKMPGTLVSSR